MASSLIATAFDLLAHHDTPDLGQLRHSVAQKLPPPAAVALQALIEGGASPLFLAHLLLGFLESQHPAPAPAVATQ